MIRSLVGAALLVALLSFGADARPAGGPEIILDERPGSGSVLVAVAVRAGSALETPETRGLTHMLEHLLFDGSERFTREEISGWADDNGVFLNAFTRKEVTVYFLLARADLLEESIEILSQMLLHPVFAPGEIAKERKVVLEEMSQGAGDLREVFSRSAERYIYRGSPLAEPVIGYPATIESVSRESIIAYYRSRYVPSNMKVFVTGDFPADRVLGWIGDYFGTGGEMPVDRPVEPRWSGEMTARVMEGTERAVLLVRMPAASDRLFSAALVLEEILSMPDSPLKAAAGEAGLPEPSVSLEVHEGFTALRMSLEAGEGERIDAGKLTPLVTRLGGWEPGESLVERAKTSLFSSHMFDGEKYHFYVMLHGEAMAIAGAEWAGALSATEKVRRRDVERLLKEYLAEPRMNGFTAVPHAAGVKVQRVEALFETLRNGIRAGVRRRPGSPVEALCLTLPGRACAGSSGTDASALLIALADSEEGRRLEEALAAMGARVQYGDNPFIPMDDYLVNPSWVTVRLEAPAGEMAAAAGMLAEFLGSHDLTENDIETAGPALAREAGIRAGHASAALRREIYRGLFPGHAFGKPLYGPPGIWTLPDLDGLARAGGGLFFGEDAAVTLVTPMEGDEGMELIRGLFSSVITSGDRCGGPPGSYEPVTVMGSAPGSSARMAAAWRLDGLGPDRAAALSVAAEALSRRMQFDIRETRGLSYSTGCSVTMVGDHAVVTAYLGTRGENITEAEAALRENVMLLSDEPLTEGETATARSRIVSRLSRRELSCAGEALSLGLDILFRGGADGLGLKAHAGHEEVLGAAGLLKWDKALLVKLLPSEDGGEKKSVPPGMTGR